MSSQQDAPNLQRAPPSLRIRNWPLRYEGWSAWLIVGGTIAAGVAITSYTANVILGLFAALTCACCTWRVWLPITFDFGPRGVVQTCWNRERRVAWPQIVRYEVLQRGVLLSGDRNRSALSSLRSIYVRCHDKQDELVDLLEFYLHFRSGRSSSVISEPEKLESIPESHSQT